MILAVVFIGAVGGAVGFTLVTPLYHWLVARELLGDGQYIFIVMWTVPGGAMMGALTAATIYLARMGETAAAGWTAAVVAPLVVAVILLIAYAAGFLWPSEPLGFIVVWGHGLLWLLCLIAWGVRALNALTGR